MSELILERPERIGSMWVSKGLDYVHGPRFVMPNKLVENSYFIRGIRGDIVRTKLALLKSNGERVIQSRLRMIRPWEKPLIARMDVMNWLIKPVRESERRLYAIYTFYFKIAEALEASKRLRQKGYRVRVSEGQRKGIKYWLVLRDDKALYYPKWYTDQRMVV